ncbi:uncharacterized protein LOC131607322 [Vicia villosa]|uniref:uncharacterized protein LOC131607322 n=1 Tax=Vicia villosa TaxID=3911 RepID=UPI00273A9949|nr:uncharacterized protein LOC131607322 [Vicia villosa]
MATTRLLRQSMVPFDQLPSSSSSFSSPFAKCVRCQSTAGLGGDKKITSADLKRSERKAVVTMKASMVTANRLTISKPVLVPQGLSELLAEIIASVRNAMLVILLRNAVIKRKVKRSLHPQMLIERAIVDCRFFTLFAVAGSLLGSVLCFLEGCVLVIESYAHYFHMLSQPLDQGHLVHLLIEAIDMFLVGTALLMFGVGLYVMFVGSCKGTSKEKEPFGHFQIMKSAPRWVGMQSIEQAKSKIGHAVMMILQVGLIDKFNNIPMVTGLDLACFAAALLTSSATIFVLSKLNQH